MKNSIFAILGFVFLLAALAGTPANAQSINFNIDPASGPRYSAIDVGYYIAISYNLDDCPSGTLNWAINYYVAPTLWPVKTGTITLDDSGFYQENGNFGFCLGQGLNGMSSVPIQASLSCGGSRLSTSSQITFNITSPITPNGIDCDGVPYGTGGTGGGSSGGGSGGELPIPPGPGFNNTGTRTPPVPTTNMTFGETIEFVYNYSLYILGVAVFVMILWAGVIWLTAGGNPAKIGKAKGIIYNAIIGAILLLSAWLILNTINPDLLRGDVGIKPLPPVR